jgi:hypothetical protein
MNGPFTPDINFHPMGYIIFLNTVAKMPPS